MFDVDHEVNPTLRLYPWLWQDPVYQLKCLSFFCISEFLFCISICPYFPLGNIGQRVSVNQSVKKLLSYQNNFEHTQYHLKFWMWPPSDIGASVTYKHTKWKSDTWSEWGGISVGWCTKYFALYGIIELLCSRLTKTKIIVKSQYLIQTVIPHAFLVQAYTNIKHPGMKHSWKSRREHFA